MIGVESLGVVIFMEINYCRKIFAFYLSRFIQWVVQIPKQLIAKTVVGTDRHYAHSFISRWAAEKSSKACLSSPCPAQLPRSGIGNSRRLVTQNPANFLLNLIFANFPVLR